MKMIMLIIAAVIGMTGCAKLDTIGSYSVISFSRLLETSSIKVYFIFCSGI